MTHHSSAVDSLTPTASPLSQGRISVRVRYCECDAMGVAHHSAAIAWFEMGRTELLRPSGVSYADMHAAGVLLAVTKLDIRYRSPARYDDVLTLLTRVTGGGRARIDHEYELRRQTTDGRDGALLVTGSSTLACVNRDARPRPLPIWLAPKQSARRRG